MNSVFLDSSYAIALVSPHDQLHEQAEQLADWLESSGALLITTRAVMLEVGNALSKRHLRHVAVRLLETLDADPTMEIFPLTEELYARAFELYRARHDKEWGLVDCISFIVMQERGVAEALTADQHFEQAGFTRLLKP